MIISPSYFVKLFRQNLIALSIASRVWASAGKEKLLTVCWLLRYKRKLNFFKRTLELNEIARRLWQMFLREKLQVEFSAL